MRGKVRSAEEVLARLGGRAYGVVTRGEMLRAGLSAAAIDRRVAKGLLIPQYAGVYRVGHAAPSVEASYMAAVKASGEEAGISGRAAAYLLGLVKGPAPPPEVSTPHDRQPKGLRVRRVRRHMTKVRGIPVTTVPETLVDLAAVLSPEDLARACHEAGVKYRTAPRHVEAILKRRPNAPGGRKLRAVMRGDTKVMLSELERRFLELLREAGLPLPQTNKRVGEHRVDCRWPGLTVELDSYRFHNSRYSWEQDRRREREARRREDEYRRYTWWDLTEERRQTVAELRTLL